MQTSEQKQRIMNSAQFKYDNISVTDSNKDELLTELADKIEKEIIKDAKNYGDLSIDAVINYLNNENGVEDNIMLGFKQFISNRLNDTGINRNTNEYRFLYAAVRFQAEKEAKELI